MTNTDVGLGTHPGDRTRIRSALSSASSEHGPKRPAFRNDHFFVLPDTLAEGQCWDNEKEAQRHLDEHEDELRLELTEDLFTMGLCERCEDVVPVFGDYVAYAPAGELVCGPCLTEDEREPAGPAILHP